MKTENINQQQCKIDIIIIIEINVGYCCRRESMK